MLSDKINELKDIPDFNRRSKPTGEPGGPDHQSGLMSVYSSRLHAIDAEFYRIMRGDNRDQRRGLNDFRAARLRYPTPRHPQPPPGEGQHPAFQLRILLTHWDHISYRQDQEKTKKNIARYVISKELKQAVESLHDAELDRFVEFYRGSPTCFTIVCEGQS